MLNPYPQYSGVLETCLALRYWFFEVVGSESVKLHLLLIEPLIQIQNKFTEMFLIGPLLKLS